MPTSRLLTTANNQFQRIEVLKRNRHKRHQYQEFFVEGVEPLNAALAHGWKFRCLCTQAGVTLSSWAENFIASANAEEHFSLAPELMQALSDKETVSELVAVISHRANYDLNSLPRSECPFYLLLDRPMNPGNLGSTIRSAAAFKADGIILCGHSSDPYDSACIRASVGTLFALPPVQIESPQVLTSWIQSIRTGLPTFQIVGTSQFGTQAIHKVDFSRPTLLLLGNETSGLSKHFLELSDVLATIPLPGVTGSLNLSSAATVFLYEAQMQRSRASG